MVTHGYSLCLLVYADYHLEFTHLALEITFACQCLQLLSCIYCIADNLANEYLMIAVQEFFDDGEYILCSNPDITLFHFINVYVLGFSSSLYTLYI